MYNKAMIEAKECRAQGDWDSYVVSNNGHPLQLWGWGEVKAAHNWTVTRIVFYESNTAIGAAQILLRKLPWPLRAMAYVPRGPVVSPERRADILKALQVYVKTQTEAVVVTIEPDWREDSSLTGWKKSSNTILLSRTLMLDLRKSADDLLGVMAKKTRQYIKKSSKEVTDVRRVYDREAIEQCLKIYRETARRAQFALHEEQYYYDIFDQLGGRSHIYIAYKDAEPIAFLWLVVSRQTAFELYGGVTDEGQRLRANYTLKWQAIQAIKEQEVVWYDLNGLLNDGVSTFKRGFSDQETHLVGTYDQPLSMLYSAWNRGLPFAKRIVQRIRSLR